MTIIQWLIVDQWFHMISWSFVITLQVLYTWLFVLRFVIIENSFKLLTGFVFHLSAMC